MLFNGIRLNTFDNTFNITLDDGDSELGDEKLYLKGGEGSMAIIDLFDNVDADGNGISDELEDFKSHKGNWLGLPVTRILYAITSTLCPTAINARFLPRRAAIRRY